MSLIVSIIIGVFAAALAAFFLLRWGKNTAQKTGEQENGMLLLQNQLSELSRVLDRRLGEGTRAMHDSVREQFGESQKLIKEITAELTHVKETSRQVAGFAEQLQSLQDILKNPKQRGILGEYYLETLLKNVLPPGSYQMQYPFADGTIVDAAVFVKDKIIPVDSKFSLENYNRLIAEKDPALREQLEKDFKNDLKKRIDETAKYIKPSERTLDFAFMFIPHEAIYYDLLVSSVGGAVKINARDLIEYAFQNKRVIIVSPTSFLAYLQTVLQGLKSLQIEEQAHDIIRRVGELGRHIDSHETYMQKLGASLGTTVSHFNAAHKEFKKIDKDVMRIADKASGVEPLTLDRPQVEDA